jgi:hypothetical protein
MYTYLKNTFIYIYKHIPENVNSVFRDNPMVGETENIPGKGGALTTTTTVDDDDNPPG